MDLKELVSAKIKNDPETKKRLKRRPPAWAFPHLVESKYASWINSVISKLHAITLNYTKRKSKEWEKEIEQANKFDSVAVDLMELNAYLQDLMKKMFEDKDTSKSTLTAILNFGENADKMNQTEWQRQINFILGEKFLSNEPWVKETLDEWAENNFSLVSSLSDRYVDQMNGLIQAGYTKGFHWTEIEKGLNLAFSQLSQSRAKLIARDQIGKLNGVLTEKRMGQAGLDMYEWTTSMDERVRGRPGGTWQNSAVSHWTLQGKICQWADSNIESTDGGKTWKPREGNSTHVHPGVDIQCRCTAIPVFKEIIGTI